MRLDRHLGLQLGQLPANARLARGRGSAQHRVGPSEDEVIRGARVVTYVTSRNWERLRALTLLRHAFENVVGGRCWPMLPGWSFL